MANTFEFYLPTNGPVPATETLRDTSDIDSILAQNESVQLQRQVDSDMEALRHQVAQLETLVRTIGTHSTDANQAELAHAEAARDQAKLAMGNLTLACAATKNSRSSPAQLRQLSVASSAAVATVGTEVSTVQHSESCVAAESATEHQVAAANLETAKETKDRESTLRHIWDRLTKPKPKAEPVVAEAAEEDDIFLVRQRVHGWIGRVNGYWGEGRTALATYVSSTANQTSQFFTVTVPSKAKSMYHATTKALGDALTSVETTAGDIGHEITSGFVATENSFLKLLPSALGGMTVFEESLCDLTPMVQAHAEFAPLFNGHEINWEAINTLLAQHHLQQKGGINSGQLMAELNEIRHAPKPAAKTAPTHAPIKVDPQAIATKTPGLFEKTKNELAALTEGWHFNAQEVESVGAALLKPFSKVKPLALAA